MNKYLALQQFGVMFAMATSAAFTVFIFLNSYETIFIKDLRMTPAVRTLEGQQLPSILNQYTIAPSEDDNTTGVMGVPFALKIPAHNISLRLTRAVEKNESWLIQQGRGHYLNVRSDGDSNIEHFLVYLYTDWRTVHSPNQFLVSSNIFVDTQEGWRYMYRITHIETMSFQTDYIAPHSSSPQIIVLLEDRQKNETTIVRGEFVNVQNINQ